MIQAYIFKRKQAYHLWRSWNICLSLPNFNLLLDVKRTWTDPPPISIPGWKIYLKNCALKDVQDGHASTNHLDHHRWTCAHDKQNFCNINQLINNYYWHSIKRNDRQPKNASTKKCHAAQVANYYRQITQLFFDRCGRQSKKNLKKINLRLFLLLTKQLLQVQNSEANELELKNLKHNPPLLFQHYKLSKWPCSAFRIRKWPF